MPKPPENKASKMSHRAHGSFLPILGWFRRDPRRRTVRAESAGEGQGATFTISLPLGPVQEAAKDMQPTHPQQTPTSTESECPPQLEGLRVLVVDDEEETLELLRFILKGCGVQVTTANSAVAALEAIMAEAFDVLISDIGMPEEGGYSLIAKVQALGKERGRSIPGSSANGLCWRRRPHPRALLRLPDSCAEASQSKRVDRRCR